MGTTSLQANHFREIPRGGQRRGERIHSGAGAVVRRPDHVDSHPSAAGRFLGAGLDTRAFRLDLPAGLNWYEIDRHEVLTTKEHVLAGCAPQCRRQTITADVITA
ncbi:MAG: class I SAM-dependent methyltransferase [Mycobacterium sp.]|nr:class I SAM-dependent methyltransferase [Mycobacterium sp.]